jgi:hypothetical protein
LVEVSDARLPYIAALEKKAVWLATWPNHNATICATMTTA